jgi:RHS repeat-associated protein
VVDPVLDPNTGLIYMQARWYDPQTAQLMTVDPLEAITQQPYAYTNDNPINGTDPSGLDETIPASVGPYAGQSAAGAGARLDAYCQQNPNADICTFGALPSPGQVASAVGTFVGNHYGSIGEVLAGAGCLSGAFDAIGVAACPLATLGSLAASINQTVTNSCLSIGQRIAGSLFDVLANVPGLQETFLHGGLPLKWLSGIVGGAGIVSEGPILAHSSG